MRFRSFVLLSAIAVAISSIVRAGDWPQILGPNRDGIAVNETLLAEWPQDGPTQIWQSPVGQGFAGVAVKDNVLFLFHRQRNSEVVEAREAATGNIIWSSPSPCEYRGGMSSDSGPRCVPVVTADHVIVFGVDGVLQCLNASTGLQIWKRETWKEFGAPEGYFGAGSSPVLFKDLVIVNVGGRDNAAVVAFSIQDGSTKWQSFADTASYSSPIVANVNGTQHVIVVTRLNTVSFNPEDGSIRFQFPFGMRGPTVNGATPVVIGDHLFVSASYRVGSVWAKITATSSDPVSSGEDLLATQYATPVKHKALLFAVDGRQDTGSASVKCIDAAKQTVLWEKGGFDYGTMIRINDELLMLSCEGELFRVAADPEKYQELNRSTVLDATPRGYRLPAISNGCLFVRDDHVLKCLHVGVRK